MKLIRALLCTWLAACAPAEVAATQLVVTVAGDPSTITRLRGVRATVHATDASRAAEGAESHEFVLTGAEVMPPGGQVHAPFSFAVLMGRAPRVKVVVEGYDSLATDALPVVEQKLIVPFQPDAALPVHVQLTDRCYALPNPCSGLDRTCWTGARACGSVPETEAKPGPTPIVMPPTPECPAPTSCTAEYPCTPTSPSGHVCLGQRATWRVPPLGTQQDPYDLRSALVAVDRVTNLVWQRERPARYEGCSGIHVVPGDRCTADEARIYCSRLRLADRRWRLPSKAELESLLDHRGNPPALNQTAFPNSDGAYWTSSPLPRSASDFGAAARYWQVDFRSGSAQPFSPAVLLSVRCVSGTPPGRDTPEGQLAVESASDLVLDRGTSLSWRRTESAPLATLDEATAYCASLGSSWRLPQLRELLTVIDPTRVDPALAAVFPTPGSGLAWASVSRSDGVVEAWIVDALLGASFPHARADSYRDTRHVSAPIPHARCVRNVEVHP